MGNAHRTHEWAARAGTIIALACLGGACQSIAGLDDLRVQKADAPDAGKGSGGSGASGASGGGGTSPNDGDAGGSGTDGGGIVAPSDAGPGACKAGELACDDDCVLDDERNCGRCGHDCTTLPFVAGTVTCDHGSCVVPASACAPGRAHCSDDPDDGCETDVTQPDDCGGCDDACDVDAPLCAASAAGSDDTAPAHCVADCDGDAPDACGKTCVDFKTSPEHCGGCNKSCPGTAHGQASCDDGECDVTCNTGYEPSDGKCVCPTCASGETSCIDGQVKACTNISNGCGEWGPSSECSFHTCFDRAHCMAITTETIPGGFATASDIAIDVDDRAAVVGSTAKTFDSLPAEKGLDAFITTFQGDITNRSGALISTAADEHGYVVASDRKNGYFIVAGTTEGAMYSGRPADATGDIFVESWSMRPVPTRWWGVQFGTSASDRPQAIAVDDDGNVFVAGVTQGGFGSAVVSGKDDLFLAKLSGASGEMLWPSPYQRVSDTRLSVSAMAIDAEGAVYIGGDVAQDAMTESSPNDVWLSRWSPTTAGAPTWERQRGTTVSDIVAQVAFDADGDIYLAGSTGGGLDGNTNLGSGDAFLMRFDAEGTWKWTEQWGTVAQEETRDLLVAADGSLYVIGATLGTFSGFANAGWIDNFLTRWQPNRTRDWTLQWGATDYDIPGGIVANADGELFVVSMPSDVLSNGTGSMTLSKLAPE